MENPENFDDLRSKIIGLGNHSSRKSYYPRLQEKISDLERFRALMDRTADGIFEAEAVEGIILEVNLAAASIFQKTKEEIIGKSLFNFFPEYIVNQIKNLRESVLPYNSDSISVETSFFKNNGSFISIELNIQVIFFDNVKYILIIARDITERIESQKKNRISEMNMRSIFDNTYDAIIIHDNAGKIIEVNSVMLKMFEITYEHALKLAIPDLLFKGEQLKILPAVWESALAGEPVIFELRSIKPITGEVFFTEIALKKVQWNSTTALLSVIRDITSRKHIEEAFLQSNKFNHEIISGAGQGIVVYDTDFCYQLWNPFMEKITGINASEVLGKKATDLFPHIKKYGIDNILQRIVEGEKEISLVFSYYVPQNKRRGWLEATYVPHCDNNDKVIGIIATMRDITERKRTEETLRKRESLLRTLIDNAPFEIWARNIDNEGILENKILVEHFGSILGKKPDQSGASIEDVQKWNSNNNKAFNREIVNHECQYQINGKNRYFQQIIAPIFSNGKVEGIAGFNIDITSRKLDELEISRANRVYAFISKISQMIISARDTQTIFKEACRIAVEYGKFKMVWIGLIDEETQDLKPETWYGDEDGYLSTIQKITILKNPKGRGPIGLAIREGKLFYCSDIETEPSMAPWRVEALKRGYLSSAALPLKVGGKVIGVLTIYASERSFFTQSEIKLLEEVNSNIEFALDMLQLEKEKQKAQEAFLKEKLFTDAVIDSVPGLLYLYDADGYLQRWNKKHIEITGYSTEELDNFNILNWFRDNPEDTERIKEEINRTLEDGYGSLEAKLTIKNGTKISFYFTAVRLVIDDKVYFTGIGIDITDRKKALEALVYNEQRLRLLSEASFEGILFSENGIIIDTNDQLLTIIGIEREDIIGHSILEFVTPESRDNVREKIFENYQEAYELFITKGDGTVISIESRNRMLKTGKRKIRISVIRDITERKQLEKDLLNSVIVTEEKERQNFSQELHDGLGPLLSATKMYIQCLANPNTKIEKDVIINDVEALLDEASQSIRDISFKLSPHILQNFGLVEALKSYGKRIATSNSFSIEINAEEIPRIDDLTETTIYRVICECINNTLKHAGAKKISIVIEKVDEVLFVFYSDDGKGFDVERKLQNKDGIGLLNMKSRLKSINGNINFLSSVDKGTDIFIKINLNSGILTRNHYI